MWDESISDSELHQVMDVLEEESVNDSQPPPKRPRTREPSPPPSDYDDDDNNFISWLHRHAVNWDFSRNSLSAASTVPEVKIDLTATKQRLVYTNQDFFAVFCSQPNNEMEWEHYRMQYDRLLTETPITEEYWRRIETEQHYFRLYIHAFLHTFSWTDKSLK